MTLWISREIVRAARHLLMAISLASHLWTAESPGPVRLGPNPYGKALRIADTTEGSTPSSRKAGRKQIISGSTLRTPTARALT